MVFLLVLGCARSPKKLPKAEPTRVQERSQTAQTLGAKRIVATERDASTKIALTPRPRSCVDGLDATLDADHWYEAAARACHPGSSRSSAVIAQPLAQAPATIDIPQGIRSSCWTAFAIVDDRALPIAVDLIDDAGHVEPLEVLSSARSAIPAFGPSCSLKGNASKLRLRSSIEVEAPLSLVFYAVSPASR